MFIKKQENTFNKATVVLIFYSCLLPFKGFWVLLNYFSLVVIKYFIISKN